MRVFFSPEARTDFVNALDHISADSPSAADRVSERIIGATVRLKSFPNLGRPGRVERTREFSVPRTPYLLVYRANANAIEIFRLLHASQNWPPE